MKPEKNCVLSAAQLEDMKREAIRRKREEKRQERKRLIELYEDIRNMGIVGLMVEDPEYIEELDVTDEQLHALLPLVEKNFWALEYNLPRQREVDSGEHIVDGNRLHSITVLPPESPEERREFATFWTFFRLSNCIPIVPSTSHRLKGSDKT